MLHARAASETERPWKTLKMAQIYDFPRAARAEHGHGAKKVLAGVRFQWTDPKKFLRPRWRAGGRSVSYVPLFFAVHPSGRRKNFITAMRTGLARTGTNTGTPLEPPSD